MDVSRIAISRIVTVAIEALSPAQARCVLLHLVEGWSETRIAAAYKVSQPSVHQCLWGQGERRAPRSRPSDRLAAVFHSEQGTGAVGRLSKAIKDDPIMQQLVERVNEPEPAPSSRELAGWFGPCRHRPEFFCAYATMILLDDLADASGRMSVSELARQMPPAIMSVVLPQLRAFGFIDNNVEPGVIRIIKLPGGRARPVPMPSSSFATLGGEASGVVRSPEDQIIERLDEEAKEQA